MRARRRRQGWGRPVCRWQERRGALIVRSGGCRTAAALAPYGVEPDQIPIAFNCFMNVPVDGITGALRVDPPLSKAGDRIVFRAVEDLIIGLTACSALQSNNGSFKPIDYRID
jgi:uncharacterized protein YcgI (DUF1989 family)